MSASFFVDTNVLVYTRDSSEKVKQPKAAHWMSCLWKSESGKVSAQVLNEYYVTVTQRLKPGLSKELARSDIRTLSVWQPIEISNTLIESAWDIQDRYGYSWWDTLIITSALFLDCRYLLSEDMQHEQNVSSLTIVNPFLVDWDEIG